MSITPVNWATIPDASPAITSNTSATAQKPDSLTDKSTFLKLLVAQIKNQNPLNPTDSVQFLAQLTQYSQLEQSITSAQELQSIHQILLQQAATVPQNKT